MKLKNRFFIGLLAFVAIAFASCNTDNEGVLYTADNLGVTFATGSQSISLPASGVTSFDVEVIRAKSSEAATVALTFKDTTVNQLFTAPQSVTFEAGKDKVTVTIQVGKIISGISYEVTLSLPDNEIAIGGVKARKCVVEKAYTYSLIGTGRIESESQAEEGEDVKIWDVEIEKADQTTWYRALSLFEEDKDIILKVKDGKVTVDKQVAWTDASYGAVSVAGKGKISEDGVMTLKLEHTVSLGSFGEYAETIYLP